MTRRRAAFSALTVVAAAGVALGFALRGGSDRAAASAGVAGARAPAFAALDAAHGHAVLVTFLDTQAQASAANNPSRAQIPFLKSMNTQNHPYGLRTVIVDTAGAGRDALVNFAYDWALARSIAVARDPDGALARRYGVTAVPTTFLVDRRGVVRRRWDGFAAAAQLDFAIRPLLGRPLVGGGTTTTSG
jgi:hypothetical protein